MGGQGNTGLDEDESRGDKKKGELGHKGTFTRMQEMMPVKQVEGKEHKEERDTRSSKERRKWKTTVSKVIIIKTYTVPTSSDRYS